MRGAGLWLSVGLALACAPAAALDEQRYAGEWSGKYVCGQGVTAIQLVVVPTGGGGAKAVANFYATPENPGVPEGCFTLTGLFDQVSGQFSLRQSHWIIRPRNFAMADFEGAIDARGQAFGGRVTGLRGCSTFSLTRAAMSHPTLAACQAAQ